MAKVRFDGNEYALDAGETVLDGLLRHGCAVPNACRAGVCQSCLMRATAGVPPADSSQALKASLASQGFFLACACVPETELEIELPGTGVRQPVCVHALEPLSDSVMRVSLVVEQPLAYRAGQYVTLLREDLARSYSIADIPRDDAGRGDARSRRIEIHVRRIPGGRFSGWIHEAAAPGDILRMQGPAGGCFYADVPAAQPLLLAGTGTGLAPLHGILQDALRQGHTGEIWLYHGALDERGLYLQAELEALAARHPNLNYVPSVVAVRDGSRALAAGRIEEAILRAHPDLKGWRAFLCGDPEMVRLLQTRVFLAGVASRQIFADAFLPARW